MGWPVRGRAARAQAPPSPQPAAYVGLSTDLAPLGAFEYALTDALRLPAGLGRADAAAQLTRLLGSPDPHARAEVAYPLLSALIARGDFDDLLPGLGDGVCVGLRTGLGDVSTDSVFRRSYSALVLASVVERDTVTHGVHPSLVRAWVDGSLHWFTHEADLRPSVPGHGRAYAVGHGADLVGAFAASRHLGADELGVLLDALLDRVLRSTSQILVDGELERLARATTRVLGRGLLTREVVDPWLARAAGQLAVDPATPVSAAQANVRGYLRALDLLLEDGAPPDVPDVLRAVLATDLTALLGEPGPTTSDVG